MLHGKKVVVVLPAYRAEKTLERTVQDIPHDVVGEIVLVEDASSDNTVELSSRLGLRTFTHETNLGYRANQKTCYLEALKLDADIIIMLHPDYQYDPRLVTAMSARIFPARSLSQRTSAAASATNPPNNNSPSIHL